MKKSLFFLLSVLVLSACNNTTNEGEVETQIVEESENNYQYYGDSITEEGATEASNLLAMLENQDSVAVKVIGTVNSSCQKKGCWMKMDLGNDKEMHVKFKDYSFFVPKNLGGETVVIDGYAKIDTIGVDHLRHLAEDAGKSEEEIAEINEPEVTVSYMASGVIIKA